MKKYKIVTLGCRTNQYESQAYADQLRQIGYSPSSEDQQADLCIINTCTVTQAADQKSLYNIRRLVRENSAAKIAVTGCLAEREKAMLQSIKGVDFVISNRDKSTLLKEVLSREDLPEFSIKNFNSQTRAFVKVQDGCNSYCSYCVIPFVRGRSRSRPLADIVQEVEGLVERGFREVVLTGINIGDFDGGLEGKHTLSDLVRHVDGIEGLSRIRISSIDPDEVDDLLLKAVMNGKKTCHSMHIVLQSGSNSVLKRMRRKYTRQDFLETIKRLRQADPEFSFTTDVIVGFPGETEAEWEETCQLVEEVEFAKVHVFPFSVRPKTRAARMPDQVAMEVINRRKKALLQLADQVAFRYRERFVGKRVDVLLEDLDKEKEHFVGHTPYFLPVLVPKFGRRSNTIVPAECMKNLPSALLGKVV